MDTVLLSKVGNFSVHITLFWDCKSHEMKYKVKETGKTFKSQNGAIINGKDYLKKKRNEYLQTHIVRRRENITLVHRERCKPEKNVWVQLIMK